jgi:hypothetical protein
VGGRIATFVVALVGVLTAVVVALFIVQRATQPLGAGDVFWQLRTGQTILDTRVIPDTETYSYTIAGAPWNNHEWLYEAALAAWHRATGWLGLRILVLLLITATLLTVSWPWLRRGRLSFALLQVCIALVLIAYKFMPAPQTVAMLMFFIGYRLFLREDLLTNARRWVGLCLFMLLFGNLTAESLMFIPFLFADQLGRVWDRPSRWPKIVVWLALPCVLLTVSPPQSSILEYVLLRGQSINAEFARLWEPPLVISSFSQSLGWAIIAGYVAFLGVRAWRARSIPRNAALGLTAVVGAMLFQRNLFLLLVPMEQMLFAWSERGARAEQQRFATLAAAALLASMAFYAKWQPMHSAVLLMPAYWERNISVVANPVGCLGAVQRLPEGSRVFTKHLWASFLIDRARNTRIFVDGRNREYPLAIHRAAFQIERGGPEALRLLDGSRTQWVLADPGWLSRVPQSTWQLQGRSENCALFARKPQPDQQSDPG